MGCWDRTALGHSHQGLLGASPSLLQRREGTLLQRHLMGPQAGAFSLTVTSCTLCILSSVHSQQSHPVSVVNVTSRVVLFPGTCWGVTTTRYKNLSVSTLHPVPTEHPCQEEAEAGESCQDPGTALGPCLCRWFLFISGISLDGTPV